LLAENFMGSTPPSPPDLERIEKGVKTITGLPVVLSAFVRDVATWMRRRQWVELSAVIISFTILILFSKTAIDKYLKEASPYVYPFWTLIGLVFAFAVVLEIRKKPSLIQITQDPGKRRAIKFLRSFEQEDAEIFARLQGHRDLGYIYENIILPDFRFGVLKGRSGCGKSSYLKAGLLAALAKTEAYHGVYIKFSNLDPLATVREALTEALGLPKAEVQGLGLVELLNWAVEAVSEGSPSFKSLILIFDQFEQFFVYAEDEARSTFVQDLAIWYNHEDLKKKVKVLVSIRGDWFDRMDEIQDVLNYTLRTGGQMGRNTFYLSNFSAEEATEILKVMAQEDLGIEAEDTVRFDRSYIQELLERELTSPTDRLISPIDLQIIAEAIKQQNVAELRSFNRTALQRLGGIEGLRRSFLEDILKPLGPESAVQVLVALTNLEQQTRAEVQSLEQLQEKVKGAVPTQEVVKIVDYLQGAALVAMVERDGIKGYELSHEGMIDAVIRLGEKVQDKVYRANQLLERRVNEWLGNNYNSRYLFGPIELCVLERQKPYLIWGVKRQQKIKLIARSKRRMCLIGVIVSVLLGANGAWVWWDYTSWGALTQIRWRLTDVSQQSYDIRLKSRAAIAFAKDGNFEQSLKLVGQIQKSNDKVSTLSNIAEIYSNFKQPDRATGVLENAITFANQIQESSDKASALISISEAIGHRKQADKAVPLFQKVLVSANRIQESSYKASVLSNIAEAISNLQEAEVVVVLLRDVLVSANQIQESSDKASVLSSISEAIGNLQEAETVVVLLRDVLVSANQIQASFDKAPVLSSIAEAIGHLKQPDLLQDVLVSANQIQESSYKADALIDIARVYGDLKHPDIAFRVLAQATVSTNKIQDSYVKESITSKIDIIKSNLKQKEQSMPLPKNINIPRDKNPSNTDSEFMSNVEKWALKENWQQALKITEECSNIDCKVELLSEILTVYAEQQHPELKKKDGE
jgi:tetratricopeptide (TPR) repeat protein